MITRKEFEEQLPELLPAAIARLPELARKEREDCLTKEEREELKNIVMGASSLAGLKCLSQKEGVEEWNRRMILIRSYESVKTALDHVPAGMLNEAIGIFEKVTSLKNEIDSEFDRGKKSYEERGEEFSGDLRESIEQNRRRVDEILKTVQPLIQLQNDFHSLEEQILN